MAARNLPMAALVPTVENQNTSRDPKNLSSEDWLAKFDSIKGAASTYGAVKSAANTFPMCHEDTLRRRYKNQDSSATAFGPPPTLGMDIESVLKAHVLDMAATGFHLSKAYIQQTARDLASKRGVVGDVGGISWMQGFLGRHPELDVKRTEALEATRVFSTSREAVKRYFQIARLALDGVLPENTHFVDETAVQLGSDNAVVSGTRWRDLSA